MQTRIQFFGVAGYQIITASGKHVVIDPFLDGNVQSPVKVADLEQVDLLLITHNASDHLGNAPDIIRKFHCPVICAKDVIHNLTRNHGIDPDLFRVTIWGMVIKEAGVRVRPVESHHWSFAVTPSGELLSGPAMGFIVDAGPDVRIYHPGDTALTYDMRLWGELYKPTVGLMHVTLPEGPSVSLPHMECYQCGELTPYEAALASQWLGLQHVVVSHYMDPNCKDVQDFLQIMKASDRGDGTGPRVSVMEPGQWLELS
jgi:L-ascorbate metabolism protein UlaG (beta-lactamase superfamily)